MKKVIIGGKPTAKSAPSSPDKWVSDRSGKTKRLTIDIPLSLHQRVKSQCALRDEKMADVVQRPIQQDVFDFGEDALIRDMKDVFRASPAIAMRIKPPAEALLFYRSAAGLAQDLRLLKARGPFKAVLQEIQERGRA